MYNIKRLSECSLEDALQAWNNGFTGYMLDVQLTMESFLKRLVTEQTSPKLSLIAYHDNQPIGIVLNGTRNIDGKKVAWIGGIAVAPTFRGQGIGDQLLRETLSIYQSEDVKISTLEVLIDNEKAIQLYKRHGYVSVDRLQFYVHKDALDSSPFGDKCIKYEMKKAVPSEVRKLSFYKSMLPWQTQWDSVREGEVLIALDQEKEPIGYVIYKRNFNEQGVCTSTVLYQCEVSPEREDYKEITTCLLTQIYSPFDHKMKRMTMNLSVNNRVVLSLLKQAGFKMRLEQVYMGKMM
ncbi:GNAT family N-acetyltransferase [Chengkuizengella axinellae]|uniref:GNAT family N-acetyltransferase n=1 Tax=Chengkuizengella axinellae TaxID=3064388 RepID=A0ABT9IX33_9BACL|nr:GNAT family N-acetyltransferase [Chengkuizengella sp. 2205SS18-9]MDP5273923.1 GNAT family N-acetyltransferase [Chengkuizengella sp. 2205SS18-9]